MAFQIGNAVTLKGSPTPVLTVFAVNTGSFISRVIYPGAGNVAVTWHDATGAAQSRVYPEDVLVAYTPPAPPVIPVV